MQDFGNQIRDEMMCNLCRMYLLLSAWLSFQKWVLACGKGSVAPPFLSRGNISFPALNCSCTFLAVTSALLSSNRIQVHSWRDPAELVALPQLSRSANEIQSWALEIFLAPSKGRGN